MRPSLWVLIILVIAALLMFGGFKKLPDAARSLGRSLRIFKAETQGLIGDDDKSVDSAAKPAVESAAPAQPTATQAAPAQQAAPAESHENNPTGSAS